MTDTIKDVMETLIEYANGGVSGLYPPEDDVQELVDYILDLQQEIERLTELCNKYEEEHKTTFEIWQKDIKENEHLRTALNTKENIIKEVRDLVKKEEFTMKQKYEMREELLEILDKGE